MRNGSWIGGTDESEARNLRQRTAAGAKDVTGESNRGPCEICGRVPGPTDKANAYDHDHSTGEFRGWLCLRCNLGLGYFKDSEQLLQAALAYLKK
jgi:hypothetical protein